ncbi:MAG: DNA cytosine methyltransferase [Christensenellaceae bacterium]|nr:DNA cytosine methyltransferase [Christensenellaceae bacterium]
MEMHGIVDIVFSGPHPQGFSACGGMQPNDYRNQLIWSFLDVVEIVVPKVFVMENAKKLTTLQKWDTVKRGCLNKGNKLRYDTTYFILMLSISVLCRRANEFSLLELRMIP